VTDERAEDRLAVERHKRQKMLHTRVTCAPDVIPFMKEHHGVRTRDLRHVATFTSRKLLATGFLALSLAIFGRVAFGQTQEPPSSPSALKKLSMEELLDIEVISVSKHPERLSETASAIQVITREDIRRSGATRLPEALRWPPTWKWPS
jgi:hypothetical protein